MEQLKRCKVTFYSHDIREGEVNEDASVTCVASSRTSPNETEHSSSFFFFTPTRPNAAPWRWGTVVPKKLVRCSVSPRWNEKASFSQKVKHKPAKNNCVNAFHRDRRGKPARPL